MFNHDPSGNGAAGTASSQDDFFSFLNPANWNKFGASPAQSNAYDHSQQQSQQQQHGYLQAQHQQHQHDYSSYPEHHNGGFQQHPGAIAPTGAMDWTSTSSNFQTGFLQSGNLGDGTPQVGHNHTPLDSMDSFSGHASGVNDSVSGVGRLVRQFENKDFNPPLPPRPRQQMGSSPVVDNSQVSTSFGVFNPSSMESLGSMGSLGQHSASPLPQSPPLNTHFGSFSSMDPSQLHSPLNSPMDNGYGSFTGQNRVASPMMASPDSSMPFAAFHESQVSTPTAGPSSSSQFGSLDDFMSNSLPQTGPMSSQSMPAPSRASATPGAPGTPGFSIWRPPPSAASNSTPKPSNNPTPTTPGDSFFRPPPPVPPKPSLNPPSQFILEFNPASKPKPKVPAKPPRPRAPSTVSTAPFSPEIKQESFSTPVPETPSVSSPDLIVSPLAHTLLSIICGSTDNTGRLHGVVRCHFEAKLDPGPRGSKFLPRLGNLTSPLFEPYISRKENRSKRSCQSWPISTAFRRRQRCTKPAFQHGAS
jgi:hypothetical protein